MATQVNRQHRKRVFDQPGWRRVATSGRVTTVDLFSSKSVTLGARSVRDGRLLELIAVPPWQVTRIIHCMPLRPKFRRYLMS